MKKLLLFILLIFTALAVFIAVAPKKALSYYLEQMFKTTPVIKRLSLSSKGLEFDIEIDSTKASGLVDFDLDVDAKIDGLLCVINPLYELDLPSLPLQISLHVKDRYLHASSASISDETLFDLNLSNLEYKISSANVDLDRVLPYFIPKNPLHSKSVRIDSEGTFEGDLFMPFTVSTSSLRVDGFKDNLKLFSTCNITDENLSTKGMILSNKFELQNLKTILNYEKLSLGVDSLIKVKDLNKTFSTKSELLFNPNKEDSLHVKSAIRSKEMALNIKNLRVKNSLEVISDYTLELNSTQIMGNAKYADKALHVKSYFANEPKNVLFSDLKDDELKLKADSLNSAEIFKMLGVKDFIKSSVKIDSLYKLKSKELKARLEANGIRLSVDSLKNESDEIDLKGTLHVEQLERFATPLSKSFELDSAYDLKLEDENLTLKLKSKEFNKVELLWNTPTKKYTLKADKIEVNELLKVFDKNETINAMISLHSTGDMTHHHLKIHSDDLEGRILRSALHVELDKDKIYSNGKIDINSTEIQLESVLFNKEDSALHVESRLKDKKFEFQDADVDFNFKTMKFKSFFKFQKESNGSIYKVSSEGSFKEYRKLNALMQVQQNSDEAVKLNVDIVTEPLLRGKVKMSAFDGEVTLRANSKYTTLSAQKIKLSKVSKLLELKYPVTDGELNATVTALTRTVDDGNITKAVVFYNIDADNILVKNINLDRQLELIQDTQNISIFKAQIPGMSLLSVLKSNNYTTQIKMSHFGGVMYDGVIYCDDCAFITNKNKVAFTGGINVESEEFINFNAALLRDDNCAFYIQHIEGSLQKPSVSYLSSSAALLLGTSSSVLNVANSGIGTGTRLIKDVGSFGANVIDRVSLLKYITDSNSSLVSNSLSKITSVPSNIYTNINDFHKCKPFYSGELRSFNPDN